MHACMHAKKLKPVILVLGLLQVVGTVKKKIINYRLCLQTFVKCEFYVSNYPNNRWKQLSSMYLNYFDVSSSTNYVNIIIIWSNRWKLPIGHSIHFNYYQKWHGSEETTHAPQSRHNESNNNFTIGWTLGLY